MLCINLSEYWTTLLSRTGKSFPRAKFEENRELRGTDVVMEAIVFIILQISVLTRAVSRPIEIQEQVPKSS